MNILNKPAIFVILASCLTTVHAAPSEEAGWINAFDGKPEHYTLTRGKKTMPVAPLAMLLVGDEIVVKDKCYRIELTLQGVAEHVVVTHNNSPFVVTEKGKVPSAMGEFWKSFKGFMSYWYKSTPEDVPSVSAGLVKGDEKQSPSMPWLSNYTRLIAGKRSLWLQWQYGKPPFKVQLTHWKQTKPLLEVDTVATSWVRTTAINFEAKKNYRVTVIDANRKKIIRGFRAVASDKVTGYPHQESLAWLLQQQDKDKWGFEILQRLNQRQ